ncbi:hypothetical protein LX32DRAFT_435881 [Colletotrichum zoysiae]|uniref:Uncharacterized protein n=1 Tax=Colletotrichum zoysiae TaxID=1216348 RepID=A0AAD9HES6_9PEZI|nr:hypothetical protein LX32DRAFT_435881 [Colletotrichum zoysiae]
MSRSETTRSPLLSQPVRVAAARLRGVLRSVAQRYRSNSSIPQLCSLLHLGLGQCGGLAHCGPSVTATSKQ